jgi:hypothetical protein
LLVLDKTKKRTEPTAKMRTKKVKTITMRRRRMRIVWILKRQKKRELGLDSL